MDVKVSKSCFIGGARYRAGDVIKGYVGPLGSYMTDVTPDPVDEKKPEPTPTKAPGKQPAK